MGRSRNLADLLDANGDVKASGLDNVPPSNDASALTTGTLSADRIAAGSISAAKLADTYLTPTGDGSGLTGLSSANTLASFVVDTGQTISANDLVTINKSTGKVAKTVVNNSMGSLISSGNAVNVVLDRTGSTGLRASRSGADVTSYGGYYDGNGVYQENASGYTNSTGGGNRYGDLVIPNFTRDNSFIVYQGVADTDNDNDILIYDVSPTTGAITLQTKVSFDKGYTSDAGEFTGAELIKYDQSTNPPSFFIQVFNTVYKSGQYQSYKHIVTVNGTTVTRADEIDGTYTTGGLKTAESYTNNDHYSTVYYANGKAYVVFYTNQLWDCGSWNGTYNGFNFSGGNSNIGSVIANGSRIDSVNWANEKLVVVYTKADTSGGVAVLNIETDGSLTVIDDVTIFDSSVNNANKPTLHCVSETKYVGLMSHNGTVKVFSFELNADNTIKGVTTPIAANQNDYYIRPTSTTDVFKIFGYDADQELFTVNDYAADPYIFIGTAAESGGAGDTISVNTSGVVGGFTGLSVGVKYYSSTDGDGTSTTDSSSNILIGTAVSSTEILLGV